MKTVYEILPEAQMLLQVLCCDGLVYWQRVIR